MSLSVLFCLVVAVSDGDTLTARCGHPGAPWQLAVRVAAIDAPELRQAYGRAARQHLVQLCLGQRARIEPVERDRYGRTVAHVRCGDSDAASEQVRTGMAWVYTRYAGSRPQLAPLERQARAAGLGLWAQRRPMAPWSYRLRYARRPGRPQRPQRQTWQRLPIGRAAGRQSGRADLGRQPGRPSANFWLKTPPALAQSVPAAPFSIAKSRLCRPGNPTSSPACRPSRQGQGQHLRARCRNREGAPGAASGTAFVRALARPAGR